MAVGVIAFVLPVAAHAADADRLALQRTDLPAFHSDHRRSDELRAGQGTSANRLVVQAARLTAAPRATLLVAGFRRAARKQHATANGEAIDLAMFIGGGSGGPASVWHARVGP